MELVKQDNMGKALKVLQATDVLGIDADDSFRPFGATWLDGHAPGFFERRMNDSDLMKCHLFQTASS